MQMTDGVSSAVTEIEEPSLDGEGASLRHDVYCILVECTRDRGLKVFRDDLPRETVGALAALMARRLAPRIGGRYVPKRDARVERDAAVWKAFTGRNHQDVMKQFGISRRLLYSILARRRRTPV
jgi:Mor family transcriptional regulator